jgi:hypothetical protein
MRRSLPISAVVVAVALSGCGSGPAPPLPGDLVRAARPIGDGARFHPPVRGPEVGACRRGLGPRQEAHVEVFAAGRVLIVPAGVGLRRPLDVSPGRVIGARCYGAVVTLDPTGLVLVRPGSPLQLSDLFRAWGQRLTPSRLAAFSGRVRAFVDGRSWTGAPASVPLAEHAEIVLEVGPYVPPHASYAFPPGVRSG